MKNPTISCAVLFSLAVFSVSMAYAGGDARSLRKSNLELGLKAIQANAQAQALNLQNTELNIKCAEKEREVSAIQLKLDKLATECYQLEIENQNLRIKRLGDAGNATELDRQIDEGSRKTSACWTKSQKLHFDTEVLQLEIAQTRADEAKLSVDALRAVHNADQLRNEAEDANAKANELDRNKSGMK